MFAIVRAAPCVAVTLAAPIPQPENRLAIPTATLTAMIASSTRAIVRAARRFRIVSVSVVSFIFILFPASPRFRWLP
mgnify:CR=1 FL=1